MRTLFLAPALLLGACASAPGADPAPAGPLVQPGAVLTYEVVAGPDVYPFVMTVTQNDDDATAFDFDLGDGTATGALTMTPAAREAAPRGMMNQFESQDYALDDQTTAWMARSDVRALKAGETVAIDVDGTGPADFTLDACAPRSIRFGGAVRTVPTCRFAGEGGRSIVAVDDPRDPLILEMDAGPFEVTYQSGR